MVGRLFGRVGCVFVGHRRSKGRATPHGKTLISVCKRCGVPMRQLRDRRWVADQIARDLRNS